MVLVLTIMAALLAAGSVALLLQVSSSKSSNLMASHKRALFCAEAGLAASRSRIMQQQTNWPLMLDTNTSNDPTGYPFTGDIDGDGKVDYSVEIRDDEDDNDATTDLNGRVFAVSTCTKYPEYPFRIAELIEVQAATGNCTNRLQKGGCASKGGNVNQ
jgi:hypothetical protein